MLIDDDLRKSVVFIGVKGDPERGGIECLGTGFLLVYKESAYLVTAQHIVSGLGDSPFMLRLNRMDGHGDAANNIHIDPIEDEIRWYCKTDDPDLDLAVMPFNYALRQDGYDCLFLPQLAILGQMPSHIDVGIGDNCYTVGLFQLVAGTKRNLPVVHRGSIALMAGQERIPVRDWHAPQDSGRVRYVECHLVETQSLQGLSGSPVFARASIDITDLPIGNEDKKTDVRVPQKRICLFGIWQGSWDAPPGEVLSAPRRTGTRVPVGMGCVVPAQKLIDLLEIKELQMQREALDKKREAERIAGLDMVPVSADEPTKVESASADNPQHREDFNRLLSAAARKQKQDD